MEARTHYKTCEVAELIGINLQCFRSWVYAFGVRPSLSVKYMLKNERWNKNDICIAGLFKHLVVDKKYTREAADEIIKVSRDVIAEYSNPFAETIVRYLVVMYDNGNMSAFAGDGRYQEPKDKKTTCIEVYDLDNVLGHLFNEAGEPNI